MAVDISQDRLNRTLRHDQPGREFQYVDGSRWGELILPAPRERQSRAAARLKVLAVAAFQVGEQMLQTLLSLEQQRPKDLQLVAVCTDDAVEDVAKISRRRRVWRFFEPEERFTMTEEVIETGLMAGLPVYTGELKIDWFRRKLLEWAPDVILVCGCGQLFDAELLAVPRFGVINFHPADLPSGHGAGAQPYRDLQERNDPWTRWTVHKMTTDLDAGPPLGTSCPIYVGDAKGRVTAPGQAFLKRMAMCVPALATILIDDLLRFKAVLSSINFQARLEEDLVKRLAQPL